MPSTVQPRTRSTGIRVPAAVPGLRPPRPAGRRPDPRPLPRRERGGARLGRRGRLAVRDDVRRGPDRRCQQIDLVAEGLDTVATIELNGSHRRAHGEHAPRLPLSGRRAAARGQQHAGRHLHLGGRGGRGGERVARRTAARQHPARTTASARWPATSAGTGDRSSSPQASGGPIRLEAWRTARIAAVRPLVDVSGTTGVLTAHVDLQREPGQDGPLTVRATVAGVVRDVEVRAG